MTALALDWRLTRPRRKASLLELTGAWRQDVITLRLEGMAGFAAAPSLLNKVRGALGSVLLEGASPAVHARQPCTWNPPCAAEVFFGRRPALRIGPHVSEITKPHVLFASVDGACLIIGMRIFGFARDWTPALVPALVQALQKRVKWRLLARDGGLFTPRRVTVIGACMETSGRVTLTPAPRAVTLVFEAPVDAERGCIKEQPFLVFERLARRIFMLARWHDVELDEDWQELESHWRSLDCSVSTRAASPKRGGHKFRNAVVSSQTVLIEGCLAPLWPLLALGAHTNLGRGASIGLGCFALDEHRK